MSLEFSILARDGAARVGRARTCHGEFETPAFMPVGTRGSVKGILPGLVRATGAEVVLGNTYHLMLRPGGEVVERLGLTREGRREGLHRFMGWDGPILTDSGGYQAYSMADMNAVSDEGVRFKSIIDGSSVMLTPERSIEVQNQLGADIIMAFDDCPPPIAGEGEAAAAPESDGVGDPRLASVLRRDLKTVSAAELAARLRQANERTVRWLERCVRAHTRGGASGDQSLFGIVQGGSDLEQRTWSVERVCGIELPGYAIGGVAVGESAEQIARVVRHTAPLLPAGKPRYLMGVGYERDIVAAVRAGVDMFDCVLPTRNGRNANAFTPTGQVRLRNARFAEDGGPIQEGCDCPACEAGKYPGVIAGSGVGGSDGGWFSRGYLRHLFMAGEMLGPILVSLHNLRYFQRLMLDIRSAIRQASWAGFAERWPVAAAGLRE